MTESRLVHIVYKCVCVSDYKIKGKKNIQAACGFLPGRVPVVLETIQGSATENIT